MSIEIILAALMPVVEAFESLQVEYYVGGSVASLAHGFYRTTADVDIIADMHVEHVRPFVEGLQGLYYIDADMIKDAIKYRSEFGLLHLGTMFKVDVFIQKKRPYDLEVSNRVQAGTLGEDYSNDAFFMESPEDIVLTKLEWYKMGGGVSDRQWGDIKGVLKVVGPTLDMGYLRRWAAVLDVSDLLEQALSDAGLK
jgi:hypothetical protein